jgi:hypothetical protein
MLQTENRPHEGAICICIVEKRPSKRSTVGQLEADTDYLQQLEIECPFCGETQPRETARWGEDEIGHTTICQSCGKGFSGLALVSTYIGSSAKSAPNC